MKYFVALAGQTFAVEVDGARLVVDGVERLAELRALPGSPVRQLLLDGRSEALTIRREGRGIWEVGARGDRWLAEAVDERTRHLRSLTGAGGVPGRAARLLAPMPGLVLRVEVEPGQRVEAGTGLIVLEAMKMENELRAAAVAVVKAVAVVPGQAVEKGQVLVEFEDEA